MHVFRRFPLVVAVMAILFVPNVAVGHGTVVFPESRVYRVYQANPSNPAFLLAANAVQLDGPLSYYTWNELSRNLPQAVQAGLPPGFDYSPWIPDTEIASGGRTDPNSPDYPRTYAGLDQVSGDWPTTPVMAGTTITVDFLATAIHSPSVWDVWITKSTWNPTMPLTWSQMEFLGRPAPALANSHFTFDVAIPSDRSGHHVLWVAWQRNDPAGEVFFSTSDIEIRHLPGSLEDLALGTGIDATPQAFPDIKTATAGSVMSVSFESPLGSYDGTLPVLLLNAYVTGFPPTSSIPGFPEIRIDPFSALAILDGTAPPTPMPPGGFAFNYAIPPGLAFISLLMQGFAIAPSGNTGNVITATDAHEVRII